MSEVADEVRQRLPGSVRRVIEHAKRGYARFAEVDGNRLAGAITYYGFLAIFPLLALAFAVLGYLLAGNPETVAALRDAISENFPGLIGPDAPVQLAQITAARRTAGLIGLGGFFIAGLGWAGTVRSSVRAMFHRDESPSNFVVRKLLDAASLLVLGIVLGLSLGISVAVGAATGFLLDLIGLQSSGAGTLLLHVMAYAAQLGVDVVLFSYLMLGLARLRRDVPVGQVLTGALMAAVGFEVLKRLGTLYVEHTTSNPAYGTVVVAVGLLVWLNLVSRLLMFCTAWAATGPDAERD